MPQRLKTRKCYDFIKWINQNCRFWMFQKFHKRRNFRIIRIKLLKIGKIIFITFKIENPDKSNELSKKM